MNWSKFVDIIALSIQLAAAIIMFCNSPNNSETNASFFDDYNQIKPIEDKRNKRLKFGFLLLLIGIGISLFSVVMK